MTKIEELRAIYTKKEFIRENYETDIFPHWNGPVGSTSVIRFLPDGDQSNPALHVEKIFMKFPFAGIAGGDSKPFTVTVPSVNTPAWKPYFRGGCKVSSEVAAWTNSGDPALKEQAKNYWQKRTYYFQGFVRESAFKEQTPPESPIRAFRFVKEIYQIVANSITNPKILKQPPESYEHGSDFLLNCESRNNFPSFYMSAFDRSETPLTDAELDAIEKYGLPKLNRHLGTMPTQETVDLIYEMFISSVNGEPYDVKRFGSFYTPRTMTNTTTFIPPRHDEKATAYPTTSPEAFQSMPKELAKPFNNNTADLEEVVKEFIQEPPATTTHKTKDEIFALLRANKAKKV